jgi:hypothetical protein
MEKGGRAFSAEDVIAMAMVLDISIVELFAPSTSVDQVPVGQQQVSRERLVALLQPDGERLEEMARHTQALRRSFQDIADFINSQRLVIKNIDNAVLGKPAQYEQSEWVQGSGGLRARIDLSREYERVRKWYGLADQDGADK